ncbi:MAG: hypothetical protein BWY50_02096 [Spirochaetes bacterium ADurb.Bin315]|nr:MAG: hypothetical protein BWY50_02096 [Spirochaetes bacterium ADurb.Bin315]
MLLAIAYPTGMAIRTQRTVENALIHSVRTNTFAKDGLIICLYASSVKAFSTPP